MERGKVGIDAIASYFPSDYVDLEDLARARGVDPAKWTSGLGQKRMAVPKSREDTATMAADAAAELMKVSGVKRDEVDAVIVGTETPIDRSKPVASIVQELLGFNRFCDTFDTTHACLSGTYALQNAVDGVRTGRYRNAVVIAADVAKYPVGDSGEPTQGAGAVAMLVSREPRIVSVEEMPLAFSGNIPDFFKPLDRDGAEVYGHYSVEANLLTQLKVFRENAGSIDNFDYFVFHVPFAGMAKKNFTSAVVDTWIQNPEIIEHILKDPARLGAAEGDELARVKKGWSNLSRYDLERLLQGEEMDLTGPELLSLDRAMEEVMQDKRLGSALEANQYVGNLYSGSMYLSLDHLLRSELDAGEDVVGRTVYMGSYGSGGGAKSFSLQVQPGISEVMSESSPLERIARGNKIDVERYEERRQNPSTESFESITWARARPARGNHYTLGLNICSEPGCGIITTSIGGLDHCPEHGGPVERMEFPMLVELAEDLGPGSVYEHLDTDNPGRDLVVPVIGGFKPQKRMHATYALWSVNNRGYRSYGVLYKECE